MHLISSSSNVKATIHWGHRWNKLVCGYRYISLFSRTDRARRPVELFNCMNPGHHFLLVLSMNHPLSIHHRCHRLQATQVNFSLALISRGKLRWPPNRHQDKRGKSVNLQIVSAERTWYPWTASCRTPHRQADSRGEWVDMPQIISDDDGEIVELVDGERRRSSQGVQAEPSSNDKWREKATPTVCLLRIGIDRIESSVPCWYLRVTRRSSWRTERSLTVKESIWPKPEIWAELLGMPPRHTGNPDKDRICPQNEWRFNSARAQGQRRKY